MELEPINEHKLTTTELNSATTSVKVLLELFRSKVFEKRGKSKKVTMLDTYYKFTCDSIKDPQNIVKVYGGFSKFFFTYEKFLESAEGLLDLPRDAKVFYGDSGKVFLEFQKYVYLGRDDEKYVASVVEALRLVKKYVVQIPTMPGVTPGSNLDKYIREFFSEISQLLNGMNVSKPDKNLINKLLKTEVVQKMGDRLTEMVESGELDPEKFMDDLSVAIDKADPETAKLFRQIRNIALVKYSKINPEEASSILTDLGEDTELDIDKE